MRLALLVAALAALVVGPFLAWGDALGRVFSVAGTVSWLDDHGSWAWLAGIGLLVADLVLPVPGTAVMAALGIVYGPVAGGAVAAGGSALSGLLGYGLCRALGPRGARVLLGARGLDRAQRAFASVGGWIVCLSRWLPVLPEVVACMAGLARMRADAFVAALLCGTVPLAFTFATVGHLGSERPTVTLAVSAGLPPLLWAIARPWLRDRHARAPA